MNPHSRLMPLALAALFIASCGGGGSENLPAGANPVLQYQSASDELRLGTLQVGQDVYPDVALRLAADGNWALKSVGTLRPLQPHESAQAVLQAAEGTTLSEGWRPSVATITVRRLHIGGKVYGNVPLQLAGGSWFWGSALQAGDDTRDLHELKALSLADFQANPALAATDTHHTVLQSSPGQPAQRFPMQLEGKRHRFCMDAQAQGADRIRLLDANRTTVVTLKAGDACVEVQLAAGRYTMEHEYGGSGAARMIFVRPTTAGAQVAPPLGVANVQGAAYPEYWAVFVPATGYHGDGYLSFNEVQPPQNACKGFIDGAAQGTGLSSRQGDGGKQGFPLFHSKNFFEVYADDGTAVLGYPLYCRLAGFSDQTYKITWTWSGIFPLLVVPNSPPVTGLASNGLTIAPRDGGFVLRARSDWTELGFGLGTVMRAATEADFGVIRDATGASFFGLQYPLQDTPNTLSYAFRLFPNGMPPSRKDASGVWILETGEVALFSGADCAGPALVARHTGLLSPQPRPEASRDRIGTFSGSVQLGPNAVARLKRQNVPRLLNQSGCMNGVADLTQDSLEIDVTTQINVETNSCEYCNLAGLDFSLQPIALRDVKLQHANLSDARLSNSDLSRADLRSATLQGAVLTNANLDGANLCNASLNGRQLPNGNSGAAAQLGGAHLRNANLAGAQLDGTNFTHASFYSSSAGACVPKDCNAYAVSTCATANGATANNASFVSAYLADADMTGLSANGADFSGAILFGARLVNAKLNRSSSTGRTVSFGSALLHGADFSNAAVDYANFLGASVDADPANNCMQINLASEYLSFPGFTVPSGASCVAPASVPAQSCVRATYGARVTPVLTNATNICAKGNQGPCLPESWGKVVKDTSTCGGTAPLCGNPFSGSNENTCWR